MFWSDGYGGACIEGRSACQIWSLSEMGLGSWTYASKVEGKGLAEMTSRFLRGDYDLLTDGFRQHGIKFEGNFETCTVAHHTFPSRVTPELLRNWGKPKSLSTLEIFLHSLPGAADEITVPYYSDDDPEIFVLVSTRGAEGSILYVARRRLAGDDQTEWTVVGHINHEANAKEYDRLSKKILSLRLASVRP